MLLQSVCICALVGLAAAADWGYAEDEYGPHNWDAKFKDFCAGTRQSPIDIPKLSDVGHMMTDTGLGTFTMTGYDSMASSDLLIKNNGHTVQVDVNANNPTLSGGGLNDTYTALQLHFHWGADDTQGSEHMFRNRQFPLEMHIVHIKNGLTIEQATAQGDGLAVLGIFFVISEEDNPNMDPIVNSLSDIYFKGQNRSVSFNFADLLPHNTNEYYKYDGSLTTPTCNEVVMWRVFEDRATISSAQLAKFRTLYESEAGHTTHRMTHNFRPVQKLLDRKVYKNYAADVPASFHWGYHGYESAEYWEDYYPKCHGSQQSPINIPTETDTKMATFDPTMDLDTLTFENYDQDFAGIIKNNGHTIQIDLPTTTNIMLKDGGLTAPYQAAQFHFHWGPNNQHGSEHLYKGEAFPLEMHIVHFKKEYVSLGNALQHDDGLAVVGFFFEVAPEANENYADLIQVLTDVKYKDANKQISGVNLHKLTHPELNLNSTHGVALPFFRYQGGLTTPPCLEIVTWTVMRNYIPISAAQVAAFREMTHIQSGTPHAHDKITENYRPTQSLINRKVHASFDYMALTQGCAAVNPGVLSMIAMLALSFIARFY